jgi:hypothetical protein
LVCNNIIAFLIKPGPRSAFDLKMGFKKTQTVSMSSCVVYRLTKTLQNRVLVYRILCQSGFQMKSNVVEHRKNQIQPFLLLRIQVKKTNRGYLAFDFRIEHI